MSKVKDNIGIINISDIHLAHDNNPTADIINNLLTMLLENKKILKERVDLLAFTGDEFDQLVTMMNNDSKMIVAFFLKVAKICENYDILIRCVEGTNSHSYRQMAVIEEAIINSGFKVDFKYFKDLAVEYIPSLDINVLYVPDELNGSNAIKTFKQVKALLKAKNLKEVDIALMHGAFHYQLPMVKLESSHTESDYLEIVKHYIFIGHIHTHSTFIRIIAAGSPDRLKHKEEEDKGIIFAVINRKDRNKDTYNFIVNKYAKTFLSIKVTEEDLSSLLKRINKTLKGLRDGSFVRFVVKHSNSVISKNLIEIKKLFPKINFTEDKVEKETISIFNNKITKRKEIKVFVINKDNIVSLITDRIKDKLTGAEIKLLNKELLDLV